MMAACQETGKSKPSRTIGLANLFIIVFSSVGAGPAGIEGIVGAGGFSLAILALVFFPFGWGYIQALLSYELASKYPRDGGLSRWMCEYFGKRAARNAVLWTVLVDCSTAAFVSEFTSQYIVTVAPGFSTYWRNVGLTVAIVAVSLAINYVSVEFVGKTFWAITLHMLVVFALLVGFSIPKMNWHRVDNPLRKTAKADWSLMLNLIIYNSAGYDALAAVIQDVDDSNGRRGARVRDAVVWVMVSLMALYVVTLSATYLASEDEDAAWQVGHFSYVASRVAGPWLQVWVIVACALTNIQSFSSSLLTAHRTVLSMAEEGVVYPWLARKAWGCRPIASLSVCGVLSVGFAFVPYKINLALQAVAYVLVILGEVACFLRMDTGDETQLLRTPWVRYLWLRRIMVLPVLCLAAFVLFIQERLLLVVLTSVFLFFGACSIAPMALEMPVQPVKGRHNVFL
jgi:amino acid transporter